MKQYAYDEIKDYIIENIDNYKDSNIYACDLHNELFNTDYYIIGRYEAEKWLNGEVFNIIGIIQQYEEDNFGEVNTDLTEPEKIVNMYVYILGEEILYKSEHLQKIWDNILTNNDIDIIRKEIEEVILWKWDNIMYI